MPQRSSVIATRMAGGAVGVFDYTRHPSQPRSETECIPEFRGVPNVEGGASDIISVGLDWSPLAQGSLLSSLPDTVLLWWVLVLLLPLCEGDVLTLSRHTERGGELTLPPFLTAVSLSLSLATMK